MFTVDLIPELCDGNPGAMRFITEAYRYDASKSDIGFANMYAADIKGDKLYMLWNDCCDRNTEQAVNIMVDNDINDILQHINYEHGRGIPYGKI